MRRFSLILWILPLLAADLVLLSPQPDFLWVAGVTGGLVVTVRTAASMVVALYAAFLFYGLGRLIAGVIDRGRINEQPFFVVYLFGVLPVYYFGLFLGLLRLNHPLVNAGIFVTGQLALWPYIRPAFKQFADWIASGAQRSEAVPGAWPVISIRVFVVFVFAVIFLFRVTPLDAAYNDAIQLYYSFFRDVRLMGGVGFDPLQPRLVDVLYGRGMGLHHFLTSFTDEYFIRFISFLLLLPMLSALTSLQRASIDNILKVPLKWRLATTELIGLALVVVIGCVPEIGKYHLFNAALYLVAISLAADFVLRGGKSEPTKEILFFVLAATLPIVSPYYLVYLSILFAALLIVGFVHRGAVLRHALAGCGVVAMSAFFSMLYNYLVLGLPELYPLELMTWFGRADVLSKWTHPAVFVYMLSIQGTHTFEAGAFLSKISTVLACIIAYVCLSVYFNSKFRKIRSSNDARGTITAWPTSTSQNLLDVTFVLAFIYLNVDLLLGVSSQASLHRMLYYFSVLQYLFIVSAAGLIFAGAGAMRWVSRSQVLPFVSGFSCLVLLAGAVGEAGKAIREDQLLEPSAMYHTARWLIGKEGFLAGPTALPWNFARCRNVDRALPAGARILALNASVPLVPCLFSPLTEHGRFIHHYESVLAPVFPVVLFGSADEQEATYKRLGIDYFLFVFNNSEFFGPSFGNLFSYKALPQHFRVYAKTDDYAILTWKGDETRPLDPQLVRAIEDARGLEQMVPQSFSYSLGVTRTWEAFRATCGPTCRLPLSVTLGKQVPDHDGTPIGNLTGYGGLAASFDNNVTKVSTSCSAPPLFQTPTGGIEVPATRGYNNFIGKDWGSGVTKKIAGFRLFPATNQPMMQGAAMNLKLQGSSDNATWTDLFIGAGLAPGQPANLAVRSGIDSSTAYRFHRVNIEGNGVNALVVCQVQFFVENDDDALP